MALNILLIWYLAFCFTNIPWINASDNSTLKEKSNITDFPTENVCSTDECRRSAEHILRNMDRHVDPCDNFYKFACGGFRNHTTIPAGKTRIIESYDAIKDRVKNQLREILEEESSPDELNAFRQMKNYYKSCMNTTALEEQGLKSLQNILKQLNGWPVLEGDKWNETNFNWIETIYKLNDLGFSTAYFMYLSIIKNPKNSNKHFLSLEYGMEEEGWENFTRFSLHHKAFVEKAMSLGAENASRVENEAAHVLGFVQILASIPKPRKPIEMTLANLTQQVPSIPWKEYFRRMLPPSVVIDDSEVILVKDPAYFSQLEKLISAVPKRVVANYMMYQAFYEIKNFLSNDAFEDNINGTTQNGKNGSHSDKNRWKDCIIEISRVMPLYLDALYVRRHFKEDTKTSVTEIVDNIKKQFKIILQNTDWMDNSTRKHALDKIDSMKSEVGYSPVLIDNNKLKNFSQGLVLNENEYLQNFLNSRHFFRSLRFSKLRGPANETEYILSYFSQTMYNSGYYLPDENIVVLPAAVLQDYFFHKDRPKYLNYGSIGITIGHEITHGFSSEGIKYGKDGNLFNWPTPATEQIFMSKAQSLIDQYENYTVEGQNGWHLNGTMTLDENIADIGGIKVAYLAYKDWAKNSNKSEPTLPGLPYNPSQMFWIKAANEFCSAYRNEWLDSFNGTHSLDDLRVFGPMSNRPEFAVDFNCPVGSKMNPEKKCSVW